MLLFGFLFCWASVVQAVVPEKINYQGYLTDADGYPVTGGTYTMTFSMYTSDSAVDAEWSELEIISLFNYFKNKGRKMKIRIFVTGGTFDKEYNELNGELYFKETHLQEMLDLGRCRIDLEVHTLMMIDSLDMTNSDRTSIVENCRTAKENRILITHGTDRMVETAASLANSIKNKTIVLTGAMVPYKFGSSDGMFNLGSALAFVQTLPAGVYISMNGRYFTWDNVKKNKELRIFQEKEEQKPNYF